MGEVLVRSYRAGTLAHEGSSLAEVPEHLVAPDSTVWIDLCEPSREQLHVLGAELGLHELAVEGALRQQRPRIDRYAAHLFLSCHATGIDVPSGTLVETEVDAFVSERWLVTVRENPAFRIEPVLERLDRSPDLAVHGVAFLLNGLLDVVVDGYFDVIQAFDEYNDLMSERIFLDQSVLARYVLGCDGANSAVRRAIGATMEDLEFEQRWLVVDVDSRVALDQWEGVHQVCDPARAATYMRIGDTRYRWEFRLLEGETAADFESIEALQPLIRPWVEGIACDQLELVRVVEYTFRAQLADHWRDRNVFLLGDAAHLTPPFIGQGLCAGIRDSMNLSWKIAGVIAGDLPESVLDTYEVERRPHARSMIQLAKLIGVSMTQGGRAGDLLRKAIAPRLHWVPALRDRLLDGETPPLHRSALVEGHGRRRSLNGRLCPNALLADGTRYDEMTRAAFVLVTAVPLSVQQRAVLAGRGAEVLEVEPGSPLHTWLADGRSVAPLVRPDFTVLRAGRDVAELCERVPTFRVA